MDAKLKDEKIMDERLAVMPFVHADYGKMPSYGIMRISEKKYKTSTTIKGWIRHMTREAETLNADPERLENNEQIYGAKDLYEDCKLYLEGVKINSNSVLAREMLLTASPQFFKGMLTKDFEHWKDINIQWLKDTFKDNLRAVYCHLDETSPHLHCLIIPKQYHEKFQKYTLQNYKYFNGYQALRDLQDSYAEAMAKDFPTLQRGIKFSKAKHNSMKKLYGIMDNAEKESREVLEAKAANQELLKMKNNYMDKTLKSLVYNNNKKDKEIENLKKELEEYKKNMFSKDLKQEKENKQVVSNKKTFSGKRYNKSV